MSWREGEWGRSYSGVCCKVVRIMGAEAGVHNKMAEVWGFAESDRGRFDEEVLPAIILPPPPAPNPAIDPIVRPAPFTLPPAHVQTSLTP